MSKESSSTKNQSKAAPPSIGETFGLNRYHFTPGKILFLVIAIAMIGIGIFGSSGSPTAPQTQAASGAGNALAPTGNGLLNPLVEVVPAPESQSTSMSRTGDDRTFLEQWSPSMVRGGFSMFIGFAIGYAIRAFLRLATLMIGAYFLILTLMAWAGWVEIHWSVIEGQFDQLVTNLEGQFASFKGFLMGSIPSAGLGMAGLASGLRQK